MRLNYFCYFRAIAIVLIVAGHSFQPWSMNNTIPEMMIANIIIGGTSFFVFISGFFFHFVFYQNFNYKRFIVKKSKALLIPYLLLSFIGFFFILSFLDLQPHHLIYETNTIFNSLILFSKYLWTGNTLLAYWYIPFIMVIFLISPIFLFYIELSIKQQIIIFIIMLAISMIIHRPSHEIAYRTTYFLFTIHSVIYFLPIYLLGIIFSLQKVIILKFIKNKAYILGLAVLLLSYIQITYYGFYYNFTKKVIFSYNGIDILIIQKILLIFFILSLLQKIDHIEIPLLKYLASISFAIFFLHSFVILFIDSFSLIEYIDFLPGIIIFAIRTVFTIAISIGIAILLKRLLEKKSSYIIGW
ncbi:MAG: hypothetical protein DIZ80_06335 [endosymbiont of Galathealinum brachiosum]|uniref:Acyltransferase 3 domain-containing protein n=1 Tax=endosymbiont of Galathealinum brachiosum TaxID=2200906 RepID=A0A370DFS0_9GAMM|nr:MAG: hypothetical protein DIZ80_06335 [endosymbiont of Galathealinum brachiosum]